MRLAGVVRSFVGLKGEKIASLKISQNFETLQNIKVSRFSETVS